GADFVARGADFVARGADFVARGADFVARGADLVPRGDDFVPRGDDFVAAFGLAFVAVPPPSSEAGRVRPSRVGRVEGRLPRTLGWAAFFGFFFADFWAIASELERNSRPKTRSHGVQSSTEVGAPCVDFKKYSA
ncbi:MAG: hypothetical protein ACRDPC_23730, partial [Solirubrobacteraceae bacterium]